MRNFIITGGELFNKGAQAMTFIAVDELRRRFPDHQIFLLSEMDLDRPASQKEQFYFEFTGWYPLKFAKCQTNALLRAVCRIRNGSELKEAEAIYRNCDGMIDVSGYALGSVWSDATCNRFLDHLEFAKAFHIPAYLMPQSFGPFDFDEERKKLDNRIRRLLPTARVIFAREQEGYDALVSQYGLKNVRLATDLVLSNQNINLSRVFKTIPVIELPEIADHSVAVIPNAMNASISNQDNTVKFYTEVIGTLLNLGKNVYLLRHSTMDADLCNILKENFRGNDRVIQLERDFSCLEFNELVKQFQFLVASRFHAIVHAYKNGIPCVVLGWAAKYHALLNQFGQETYMLDVRNNVAQSEIQNAIIRMNQNYLDESQKIKSQLAEVQKDNAFDAILEK